MEPRGYGPPRPKRPHYKRYYRNDYVGRAMDNWVSVVDQLQLRATRARIAAIRAERAAAAAAAAAAARRSLAVNRDRFNERKRKDYFSR